MALIVLATLPVTTNAQGRSVDNPRYQKQDTEQRRQSGRQRERQCDVSFQPAPGSSDPKQLYRRGVSQFLSPRSAIASFSQVIDVAPDLAMGYRGRAWASLSNRCNFAAIDDFTKILELEPDDSESYRGRAWAFLLAADYARAADDFKESIRRSRNPAESFAGLGLAELFGGNLVAARSNFRLAMQIRPGFNDAAIYSRSGDFLIAPAVDLRTIDSFSPQGRILFEWNPRYGADVSTRLDDWGRYAKIQSILRQQLQRSSRDADAWLAMAVTSYRQLDDDPGSRVSGTARREARSAMDRAVTAAPDVVDIRMARAMLLATPETADPDGALADLNFVVEHSPNDSDAYLRRSMVLAMINRFDPAIADCETAGRLAPDNAVVSRICMELRVRRTSLERSLQAKARYEQRHQEMEGIAWIALAAIIGGFYKGFPVMPL
jgi:tetratricopeptide (TPR) repeat protein